MNSKKKKPKRYIPPMMIEGILLRIFIVVAAILLVLFSGPSIVDAGRSVIRLWDRLMGSDAKIQETPSDSQKSTSLISVPSCLPALRVNRPEAIV